MGFETFRVEPRGGSATYAQTEGAVRQLRHARLDHDSITSRGAAYYTIEDGFHVVEVEVADSPVKVSCRFTLCHPPSVDAAFLGLVRELQARLGMEAKICDDVRQEHAHWFSPDRFSELASIIPDYVAKRRADWIAQFGTAHLPAETPEVYEKLILPKCVPIDG